MTDRKPILWLWQVPTGLERPRQQNSYSTMNGLLTAYTSIQIILHRKPSVTGIHRRQSGRRQSWPPKCVMTAWKAERTLYSKPCSPARKSWSSFNEQRIMASLLVFFTSARPTPPSTSPESHSVISTEGMRCRYQRSSAVITSRYSTLPKPSIS